MNLKALVLSIMALIVITTSCTDDPEPTAKVAASFDIESVDALTVILKNKSANATTYEWDFGDGNTSLDKDPTHTYASEGTYTIKLVAESGDESHTASKEVMVTNKYKSSGFVISSVASSSGGSTYYSGYFADQPSGDIDLTAKQAFGRINFKANRKGYLYGWPTTMGEFGLRKYAIDGETEQLVELGELALLDSPGDVTIVSDELGFVSFFGLREIKYFNPMTMEILGDVDMSGAKAFAEGDDVRTGYNSIVYNPKTNKLYATAWINDGATPQFYDANEVWVEVINVDSKKREKTTVHPDAQYILDRGNADAVVDEEGNTYFICQGSYGIDQQIGPTARKASRPQIIRLNTNSDFDTDYAFNPINSIGFENNWFQIVTSMVYAENNKAYAIGTAKTDAPEIVALLGKLATGTITAAEYDQLVYLVLYTESMAVMEIDLPSKSVNVVDNTSTAGFAYPYMYYHNGKVITQVTGSNGTFNGFYEIDPATGSASQLFNISAGGLAINYIDIAAGY